MMHHQVQVSRPMSSRSAWHREHARGMHRDRFPNIRRYAFSKPRYTESYSDQQIYHTVSEERDEMRERFYPSRRNEESYRNQSYSKRKISATEFRRDPRMVNTPKSTPVSSREREGPPPLKRIKKSFKSVDMYAREADTIQVPFPLDEPATFWDVLDTSNTVEVGSDFWSSAVAPKSKPADPAPVPPTIQRMQIRWDSKTSGKILVQNPPPVAEVQTEEESPKKRVESIFKPKGKKNEDGATYQKVVRWDSKIAGKVLIRTPSPKSEVQQAAKKNAESKENKTDDEATPSKATPSKVTPSDPTPPAPRKSKRLLAKSCSARSGQQPTLLFQEVGITLNLPKQATETKTAGPCKQKSGAGPCKEKSGANYAAHSSARRKKNVNAARAA